MLISGCASNSPRGIQKDDSHDAAQVRVSLDKVFAAVEQKDFAALDALHLYGPKFTKFSGSSAQRLDADLARRGEHEGIGAAKNLKLHAEDLKVDVFSEVAIATFTLKHSFEAAGETVRRSDRATLVFVKEGRGWKIAHEHLSSINP